MAYFGLQIIVHATYLGKDKNWRIGKVSRDAVTQVKKNWIELRMRKPAEVSFPLINQVITYFRGMQRVGIPD